MDKPKPKKEAAIVTANKPTILVNCTKDALEDFKEFCQIITPYPPSTYSLWIDSRYDFDEVIEYIKNY